MRNLAVLLQKMHKLRYTKYADDITIWVESKYTNSTIEALDMIQKDVNPVAAYLPKTGMKLSLEKANYIFLG